MYKTAPCPPLNIWKEKKSPSPPSPFFFFLRMLEGESELRYILLILL